ncbi:hypothetical protein LK08_32605, partial [Streptomyces sp. MUSC 125]
MTRTNGQATRRRAGTAASVLVAAAVLAGGTAAPAQASWSGELQTCKDRYGSEYYLGWDIPTVVLARGSTGVCVRELQEELVEAGAVA